MTKRGHPRHPSGIGYDIEMEKFDVKYYWIADRQGRTFKKLSELYAANGQVGFMGTQRVDGKLILPEAIKVLQQKSGSSS